MHGTAEPLHACIRMPHYVFRLEPSPHTSAEAAVEEHPHADAAFEAATVLTRELAGNGQMTPLERLVVTDEHGGVVCDLEVGPSPNDGEENY